MKHRLLSILSLFIALSLFAGCGQAAVNDVNGTESNTTDETTTAEVKVNRLDELGTKDFNGETFVILDTDDNVNFNIPQEEKTGDIISDAIFERNVKITELYNIQFKYETCADVSERASLLRKSVMANDNAYDLMFSTVSSSIGPLSTEGILANLCDMKYLTLDAEWWSPLIYESLRLENIMYYTTGDISPISYRAPACYYVNETLLENNGIDKNDLYEYVENGTWTLDMLNKLAGELDRDLNGDDLLRPEADFFGILNEDNDLTAACFMVSSGISLSSVDKDGHLYSELQNGNVVNAIEKLSSILSKVPRESNDSLHNAFKNDRVMFLMHYASSGYTRYRDMQSNYLVLPLPKYDENQKTYRSLMNTWMNAFVCVPTNADTKRAGFIMEAMAYLSHNSLRSAAYELSMKQKGARNDKDAVMLDTIYNTLYLDFNSFMNFGGSLVPITNAIFKDNAYLSAAQSVSEATKTAMDTFEKEWTK